MSEVISSHGVDVFQINQINKQILTNTPVMHLLHTYWYSEQYFDTAHSRASVARVIVLAWPG